MQPAPGPRRVRLVQLVCSGAAWVGAKRVATRQASRCAPSCPAVAGAAPWEQGKLLVLARAGAVDEGEQGGAAGVWAGGHGELDRVDRDVLPAAHAAVQQDAPAGVCALRRRVDEGASLGVEGDGVGGRLVAVVAVFAAV